MYLNLYSSSYNRSQAQSGCLLYVGFLFYYFHLSWPGGCKRDCFLHRFIPYVMVRSVSSLPPSPTVLTVMVSAKETFLMVKRCFWEPADFKLLQIFLGLSPVVPLHISSSVLSSTLAECHYLWSLMMRKYISFFLFY